MAVATTNARDSFACNGATTAFPLTFSFLASSTLVVTLLTISSGSTSTLVLGTDYTVTGGDGETGTVSTISTYSASFTLIVDRVQPYTQPTVFSKYGGFPAKVVEGALDRLTYLVQQLLANATRVLRQPVGDTTDLTTLPAAATRRNKVLYFSDTAAAQPTASDSTISTFESGVSGAVQASTSAAASSSLAVAAAASSSLASASSSVSAAAAAASAASISLPLPVASGGTGASTTSGAVSALSLTNAVKSDTTASFTVGFVSNSTTVSTVSSGSYTPDPTTMGHYQAYVNGGAHNFVAPSVVGNYPITVQVTNNASAGTITPTGFTKVTPTASPLTTTNGDDFIFYITKVNGFTHLHIQALQ